MHEADAVTTELARLERKLDDAAGDAQLGARVRLVEARQDLDQRRLAGAVLPQQPVDLAARHREGGGVECLGAAEGFGKSPKIERGRDGGRLLAYTGRPSLAHCMPQSFRYPFM